jgi:diguanylate cyclase (GGDEF)-like protein
LKILVADDDPVSRRLMERTLQKSGYEVIIAENGAQAFEQLSREDGPRLALVDWMMPELDGLEVCRKIRSMSKRPYIYITLLSSRLSNRDIVTGLEAGADDYLTKPCNPEELNARLRTGQRILCLEDTLVKAREEMRFQATHDAMTGLLNHAAILACFRQALSGSAQEHILLSLVLCDLDHFKRVNDVHGHLVGDEILRQVAVRLRESIRSCDAVGRYGGEEFLIVLRNCGATRLRSRAEQIRTAVACRSFPIPGNALSLSLSLGALAVGEWNGALPMESLLEKVDNALYLAKSAGRNRVVCSDG